MSFHENLKKLRKAHNISQEKLAEVLDVSRQAVAKYKCSVTGDCTWFEGNYL